MLNKQSIEIYTLSDDREKRLWQDCIFVFDTSALLEFYLYSDQASNTVAKLRGFNGCRSIVNTTKRGKLGKNLG